MATPTEPTTSAIFRAMRHLEVNPELAYEVAEESGGTPGEPLFFRHCSRS